ncbi:CaiB/BaiF CoA transferase family protein [Arvimicrobium flavum]|uniref:CaiB/BaiF CoA transferase family protein n=1 Tax=Arvimicrobium flavum TaxID=3393320 RepID=UPI00237A1C7B|nr:CoA transferase [Mesorhizobium shangrilense]
MKVDASAPSPRPLDGVRVIELGSTVAGPFCGRLLADFGADVIKVEQKSGDAVRSMGKRNRGRSLYAASIFRNKRNVSIDLQTVQGRDLVRRLCEKADIVVENFKPGTLERWGLDHDTLSLANPGLISVRISGYGQTGPYSSRPGYGVVCEAVSGMREITGDPDRPPARVAVSLTDYITGLYAAFGAVMALKARQRSGRGQVVDAALYEAAFSFMEPHVPAYQQLGVIARRAGPRLPDNTPNSLYPTGDGRHVHIAAITNPLFGRLATAMDRPDLAQDPRFAQPVARSENEDALDALIGDWTSSLPVEEVEARLQAVNVPASRIYDMSDIFADPHYAARGMIATPEDPELGPVAMPNVVPRLSETPGRVEWIGRDTGADTRSLFETELGLSADEVAGLIEAGVLHAGPMQAEPEKRRTAARTEAGGIR